LTIRRETSSARYICSAVCRIGWITAIAAAGVKRETLPGASAPRAFHMAALSRGTAGEESFC
jgi:hypothetical protein